MSSMLECLELVLSRVSRAGRRRAENLCVRITLKVLLPPVAMRPKLVRLGTEYGGWWVPVDGQISPNSSCYLIGAGEDISFDVELAKFTGAFVVIVDPTPRARHHFESIEKTARDQIREFERGRSDSDSDTPQTKRRLEFLSVGVSDSDTIERFYAPQNPAPVSHSIVNLQGTADFFEAKCYTLKSLVTSRGDGTPALLKLDIEGAEHRVVRQMINDEFFPPVLLIEFDDGGFRNMLTTGRRLRRAGYRIAKRENRNVLLLRHFAPNGLTTMSHHDAVSDPRRSQTRSLRPTE